MGDSVSSSAMTSNVDDHQNIKRKSASPQGLSLDIPPPDVGQVLHQDPQASSPREPERRSRGVASRENTNSGAAQQWPSNPDTLGSPSAGIDRVFPIRSVVSVDPSQTPFSSSGRSSTGYFPSTSGPGSEVSGSSRRRNSIKSDTNPDAKRTSSPRRSTERRSGEMARSNRRNSVVATPYSEKYGSGGTMNFFSIDNTSDQSSQKANSIEHPPSAQGQYVPPESDTSQPLITARFKHIVTKDGHAIITGRDGETLQRCEDEPIHIPGAIQSFGLLLVLEEIGGEEGQLSVRVVSENSYRIIGFHPQDLFRLKSFTDILSEEQAENLLDHIDFIRDEDSDPATNGPEVFTITIKGPHSKKSRKLWCAVHINPAAPDSIICEFELDDDKVNPLVPADEESTPDLPEDTLESRPTQEEFDDSTLPSSKPLRVLRSARKRKGEAAAMEVFNILSQVQEQLSEAQSLDIFLKILVGVVKELTGFHRVMIYQFDAMANGRVVTELVDPRATKDLYKGLNFPASDIPKQARDLYKINKVRLLYDRDQETSRLVCKTVEDLEEPVDLTFSYLRAMSPIHIKYLTNMAVRSSMSISINAFGELWGLISCHTYGAKGMRVPFPIRKMCRLVGDTASRNIERLSYASRLQARKLINTVPTSSNPSGYIIASSDDLLKLFDADFGLLSIRGETKLLGAIDQTQEALAMLEYLRLRKLTSVMTSQDIKMDFPDLRYPPGFDVIAGLLLVPLSVGGADFIVFFRKPQIREVKWAGNPYEKFVKEGTEGYLEPRKSFKTWSETVVGKCREWTEEQVETAAVLCLVYGKFIEVWRQKELAMQNSQLTKLLLANSAHEVRTPLNAIINYLEIALEGPLDPDTREHISKSHSASKSLIYVINDLLDLTKTEEGQDLIKEEMFDLPASIREAADAFRGDAKRKDIDFQVIEHPGFPQDVYGDQRRTRQAVANIIANSIQNTPSGWIRIEMYLQDLKDSRAVVEIVISDSGVGISDARLDELFRELEQVTGDNGSLMLAPSQSEQTVSAPKNSTLGLGLAMVARHVRNAEGQLRLKSEEGKGSRFVIQLPFTLVVEDDAASSNSSGRPALLKQSSDNSQTSVISPPIQLSTEGERTLVDTSNKSGVVSRRGSYEEMKAISVQSFRTGSSKGSFQSSKSDKSDVDRLIDAISGPLFVGEPESEERSIQRRNSKGSMNSARSAGSLGHKSSMSSSKNRPTRPGRSVSFDQSIKQSSPQPSLKGAQFVTDNKTPLSAIRMPDEFNEEPGFEHNALPPSATVSKVTFDIPEVAEPITQINADHLRTLVAEDDPINSKIITKRLERSGHSVFHTINGEECASAFGEREAYFDIVLMDMQMPIVDGLTSTKMIRSIEKSQSNNRLSERAALNGRIPIFAVSASLVERERQKYIDAGFDGWILKPIDFKRLNILMRGIVDDAARDSCVYQSGQWEKGGWFQKRQPDIFAANTNPSQKNPTEENTRSSSGQKISAVADVDDAGDVTPTPERLEADANERLRPSDVDADSQSNSTTPTGETPVDASDTDSVNTTPATADRQSGILWGEK